jgi:hypothetical protein
VAVSGSSTAKNVQQSAAVGRIQESGSLRRFATRTETAVLATWAGNIDEQCFDLLCEPALNRQAF